MGKTASFHHYINSPKISSSWEYFLENSDMGMTIPTSSGRKEIDCGEGVQEMCGQ